MITARMSYKTLIALPDSVEKFYALGRKLMALQHHGQDFFKAKDEYFRLYKIYGKGETR